MMVGDAGDESPTARCSRPGLEAQATLRLLGAEPRSWNTRRETPSLDGGAPLDFPSCFAAREPGRAPALTVTYTATAVHEPAPPDILRTCFRLPAAWRLREPCCAERSCWTVPADGLQATCEARRRKRGLWRSEKASARPRNAAATRRRGKAGIPPRINTEVGSLARLATRV